MTAVLPVSGRIGPNAITRVAESLSARLGAAGTAEIFASAELSHRLRHPPGTMVDEAEVRRLHAAVRAQLGADAAAEVARDAGARTAAYLLAHRIPKLLQRVLRRLPARLAARVLLAAIGRHAWTFVGSGRFESRVGGGSEPVVLVIRDNPLCRGGWRSAMPACDFYAATFGALFASLVHAGARIREVACEACGDAECRFEIAW